MRAKRPVPWACGSYQTDDSIGSRVKDTNSEIRTAAETMRPNWKKKRPMMPPMKATGRNTATMQKVVASTASPISLVPSMAAWRCDLPKPMWRMMFSRTTMAVVDQDADGERQRHQREHVQREAEGRHHHEGAEHRDRQGEAGDHRAAPGMQEQEDDGDGEQAALDHGPLHVVDRVLDAARAVAHDLRA
jgi:hypothetical protein